LENTTVLYPKVQVIDSHTGGEPTRIVVSGGPDLGSGTFAKRREIFRDQFDQFRSAVVDEPRGSEILVGGLLCPPKKSKAVAGIVFFNNVGVLNMCGHGMIGLTVTLSYLERIGFGAHLIETPVGDVSVRLGKDGQVTVTNVPSYRYLANIVLEIPGEGVVRGDVAWGGNWFFLVEEHQEEINIDNTRRLIDFTARIRDSLEENQITGSKGEAIDHVELFGPGDVGVDSRNFVLCPGDAYDRSPCGTGCSAKIACLMADGKLQSGETWRQQSIVGSVFEIKGTWMGDQVIPEIVGSAFVNSEATLVFDPRDPFRMGLRGGISHN
jgi:4-hydroxyproline epimerase